MNDLTTIIVLAHQRPVITLAALMLLALIAYQPLIETIICTTLLNQ